MANLTIRGTRFLLDGEPFAFTGVSFFNALYNPAFNAGAAQQDAWLERFRKYGINVLRIWAQWDCGRGFIDACEQSTLYEPDGALRPEVMGRIHALLEAADRRGMVIELALFANESRNEGIVLEPAAADRAVAEAAARLKPHRNLALQIWNECDLRVEEMAKVIRAADPRRLICNSCFDTQMFNVAQNSAMDYLTPHTTRQNAGDPWQIGPAEIACLLKRYNKPVVDDEPARCGTRSFGGPPGPTSPYDHILQIYQVWQAGGYVVYHHDMFQTGYGSPAVPPDGVPDPEFSPYHRQVFEFLALRERYMPQG